MSSSADSDDDEVAILLITHFICYSLELFLWNDNDRESIYYCTPFHCCHPNLNSCTRFHFSLQKIHLLFILIIIAVPSLASHHTIYTKLSKPKGYYQWTEKLLEKTRAIPISHSHIMHLLEPITSSVNISFNYKLQ